MKNIYKTAQKDGLSIGVSASNNKIAVWESEDNPHGVNYESSCSFDDWKSKNQSHQTVRYNIVRLFGQELADEIDNQLK